MFIYLFSHDLNLYIYMCISYGCLFNNFKKGKFLIKNVLYIDIESGMPCAGLRGK